MGLSLPPHTSQLKGEYHTHNAHAVVTLPQSGRGTHPENLGLALDGRCRNLIAGAGGLGEHQHTGSLYWTVTRTLSPKEANLGVEIATFEQHTKVQLSGPAAKKRKLAPVEWRAGDMPGIPVLVNRKALPKHTRLLVHQPERKRPSPIKKDKKDTKD